MSVTGIGGFFFKCRDPRALRAWYSEHLGLEPMEGGGVSFECREEGEAKSTSARRALTTWAPNQRLDTKPIYRYPCHTDIS